MNIAHHLERHARERPAHTALIADREVCYGDLWLDAKSAASTLLDKNIVTQDRIVLMLPMSIRLYEILIGSWIAGGTVVFIDPWIKRKQLSAMADFAEPTLYIGKGKAMLLRWMTPGLRRIPKTWWVGQEKAQHQPIDVFSANDGDTALITFTSGSSGIPKGANRTHGLLNAQHAALSQAFPYLETDVDMTMFPVFALNNLATGITTVVPDMDFRNVAEMDAQLVYHQIQQHGVTTCTASPPFFDHLANLPEPPVLRRILAGGAPVSDAQLKRWRAAFPDTEIVVVYGSTEAEPTAHISLEERLACKGPGYCCGTPVLDAKLIEIQPHGPAELHEMPPGKIGELVVSGEHVCRDYFKNSEATRENKILDGETRWHRMGDTGYFDPEGHFWLTGRVHSSIAYQGGFAQPQLIEQAARGDDESIQRIAAIEHRDQICVVVQSDQDLDIKPIQARCHEADQPCDRVIVTTKPLPVDPRHNSKIDYPALKGMMDAL